MTLLNLDQVAPRLLWLKIREISTCFLLGTLNQMGFEVLIHRQQGRGTKDSDPITGQWGKEGLVEM